MIIPRYRIALSKIPGAGKGLFLDEVVRRGEIITAPDDIRKVHLWKEIETLPDVHELLPATVRWFQDYYTITTEWPDECYINHSFNPTGLWHLGFVFALTDLEPGREITVDYRHLLSPGQEEDFCDSTTNEKIIGYSWEESLHRSTEQLLSLLK